jgi:transcriptional regulator
MYIPKQFNIEDETTILNFIKKNGFAIIVNQGKEGLVASHIPLILRQTQEGTYSLLGHLSKANPQWQTFEAQQNQEVLVIFNGAHTFITADWYEKENVSTWNYLAVHAYGIVRLLEKEALYQSLQLLSDKYEAQESQARLENLNESYVQREMRGIVGIEIKITKLEGKAKLSQNRNDKDYQHIIKKLEERNEGDDMSIAQEMEKRRCPIQRVQEI